MNTFLSQKLEIRKEINFRETEKFKLSLKSNPELRNPYNFIDFYSGGPVQLKREIPIYNPLIYMGPSQSIGTFLKKSVYI